METWVRGGISPPFLPRHWYSRVVSFTPLPFYHPGERAIPPTHWSGRVGRPQNGPEYSEVD
jgi:hypothetical protein